MTTVAADTIPGLDDSTLTRALYSTDASLYRVVPQGVAHPRTVGELEAVVDAARPLRAEAPVVELVGGHVTCDTHDP